MAKEEYTKIPNEILEALAKTKLCGYEIRYIWFLLRKTYGWSKKSDYIANSQFVRATGIKKQHIWRTEQRLLWRKIVTKRGNKVALNPSYEQWKELPEGVIVTKSGIEVTKLGIKVTQNGGHKEHLPKKTKQKKYSSSEPIALSMKEIISYFRSKVKEIKGFDPEINWGKESKLVKQRLSKFTPDELRETIDYYLKSEDSKKLGASLSACLSNVFINKWQEAREKEAWQYGKQ